MRARATRPGHGAGSDEVTAVTFGPAADRRNAADRAHRGDLEGALGVISAFDTGPRRGAGRRLAALTAVLGPGLVVMAADNDAGGISTYAQAGQDYGVRIAWLVVLLVPVLFVCQEMAARLGAVTGAGHARLITARFGRRWGGFALADLLALNLLTLVTEFVGVSLSLGYFGISRLVSVPVAAAFLIAVTVPGSFRGWERAMYVLIAASLAAVPLAAIAWAHRGQAAASESAGAAHGGAVFLAVALVGTTVAPWQLFFQQSNVIDKRITTRFLGYERADTALGTVLFAVGALGVLLACALVLGQRSAFGAAGLHGAFTDAAVQALAGVLLPSATVFLLLLLCNDREVLGPLVNPRWLNVLAATVIGALLGLSALLTATTIVPRLPLAPAVTGLAIAIGVLVAGAALIASRARPAPAPAPGPADRRTWTMPPIESLSPPARSAWRTLGLVVLRCYLLAAVTVLAVRAIQLALGAS